MPRSCQRRGLLQSGAVLTSFAHFAWRRKKRRKSSSLHGDPGGWEKAAPVTNKRWTKTFQIQSKNKGSQVSCGGSQEHKLCPAPSWQPGGCLELAGPHQISQVDPGTAETVGPRVFAFPAWARPAQASGFPTTDLFPQQALFVPFSRGKSIPFH